MYFSAHIISNLCSYLYIFRLCYKRASHYWLTASNDHHIHSTFHISAFHFLFFFLLCPSPFQFLFDIRQGISQCHPCIGNVATLPNKHEPALIWVCHVRVLLFYFTYSFFIYVIATLTFLSLLLLFLLLLNRGHL